MSTVSDVLTIKIGGDPNDKKAQKHNHNQIKSTKYTLITFLPQNLLEQFRRIANFYFLIMVVISIVIGEFVVEAIHLNQISFNLNLNNYNDRDIAGQRRGHIDANYIHPPYNYTCANHPNYCYASYAICFA